MKDLPAAFSNEMQDLFAQFGRSGEYPQFLTALASRPSAGLRANRLKISAEALLELLKETAAFGLAADMRPVEWTADGYRLPADSQPGRLPWHSAGLYYIQEPSAMLPAQVLAARPGERILDLCAAPGGKSCRIAADLAGQGLLWANEISAERARALLHNLELTGCRNSLITQEPPERLAGRLPGCFDGILVDAPCSGSGMFRRDPSAIDSWLAYGSQPCTALQRDILESAWTMLRPGGRLVYSTCTFAVAENEAMIAWLTDRHSDCRVEPIVKAPGVSDGLPLRPDLTGTARIWPHLANGDGHFCALLRKDGDPAGKAAAWPPARQAAETKDLDEKAAWQSFDRFCQSNLSSSGLRRLQSWRETAIHRLERSCLHLLPPDMPVLEGVRKIKTGLFLGQVRVLRDRSLLFEPSQAFLFSLTPEDLRYTLAGEYDSAMIRRYLRGETISLQEAAEGPEEMTSGAYVCLALRSSQGAWPLGWGKAMSGGLVKNLYPQAWRRLI